MSQFSKALGGLSQRLRLTITKALVDSVDDTTAIQLLKLRLLSDEVVENVERVQEYGFSSVPPADSELLVAEVGGSRDHLVAFASDNHESRPIGAQIGEVSIWSQHGQRIHHKADGSTTIQASTGLVRVEAAAGSIEINNGNITIDGNLVVTGTTTLQQTLTCTGAATFNSTMSVIGNLTSLAIITGLNVVANLTGLVTLASHTHSAFGSPPTPGS